MNPKGKRRLPLLIAVGLLAAAPGCMTLPRGLNSGGKSLVPTRYKVETGPYAIYTNTPLARDAPEVIELVSLEKQVRETLDMPAEPEQSEPIEIYILDDRASFNHFLTFYYSELPPRRAFFFAQGPRRVVYTFQGKSLEQDLRHEATHALLSSAYHDLPLWLDEGLAEYFEVDPVLNGLNTEDLGKLRSDVKDGWTPDLDRLEQLTDVRQMGPRDYREAWAWTHYLLQTTPENRKALLTYMQDLGTSRETGSLAYRLRAGQGRSEAVLAHVSQVRASLAASGKSNRHETYRCQDDALTLTSAADDSFEPRLLEPGPPRGPLHSTARFFQRLFAPLRPR